MVDVIAKLKAGKTIHDVALEISQINTLVGTIGINPETGEDYFPRPIPCNPNAEKVEDMIGNVCTPPDEYGRFVTRIDSYEYIDWSVLPAAPSTFTVMSGKPASTGVFA